MQISCQDNARVAETQSAAVVVYRVGQNGTTLYI